MCERNWEEKSSSPTPRRLRLPMLSIAFGECAKQDGENLEGPHGKGGQDHDEQG